MQFKDKHAS